MCRFKWMPYWLDCLCICLDEYSFFYFISFRTYIAYISTGCTVHVWSYYLLLIIIWSFDFFPSNECQSLKFECQCTLCAVCVSVCVRAILRNGNLFLWPLKNIFIDTHRSIFPKFLSYHIYIMISQSMYWNCVFFALLHGNWILYVHIGVAGNHVWRHYRKKSPFPLSARYTVGLCCAWYIYNNLILYVPLAHTTKWTGTTICVVANYLK